MRFVNYNRLVFKEFIGLSSFQFLVFFRRLLIYTFLAIYLKEEIGLSTTEITLMATLPMIISASSQSFLWGPLLDKINKSHYFVIIGETIAAILHLVLVQFHIFALDNYSNAIAGYVIIFMLIIIEFPWSASNVGLLTLIAERTDDRERTRLIGHLSIGGGIGAILGAFAGSIFYDEGVGFSRGDLFYIASIVMIFSAIMIYITIKDDRPDSHVISELTDDQSVDSQKPDLIENNTNNEIFELKYHFIPFLIALTLINFGRNGINIITSLFIANDDSINATDTEIAMYRNLGSIATLVTGVIVGSRLGEKNDTLILQIGISMSFVGLIWLGLTPNYEYALLSALLLGSANIIVQASSYSITARIVPSKKKGRLIGYYNATFFLSWGLGATILFAPLVDILVFLKYSLDQAYRVAFYAAGIMVIIGFIVFRNFLIRVRESGMYYN